MRVAIVGAGICGLYLAWKLSEKGNEVFVFEKREKIGKEVCSGLLSEIILEFIPESKKLIQNQIEYCLIHLSSFRENESADGDESKLRRRKFHRLPKRTLKVKFSKKFFVMNHFELDNLLAKLAQKAGAKIFLNRVMLTSDVNILLYQEKFDGIIGCDGANSIVRKNLGLNNPDFCLGIRGFIEKNDSSNFVETWPTKNGFIWKIPRGGEVEEDKFSSSPFANARVIEYGIIEKPERAREIFEKFLREKNLKLEKVNSAIIPQGLIIPKNQRITLCGDAAGLTKPWSGGGVVWGLISANILLKNFPDFLKYQKEIKKFFLPKIIFSKIIKKLVYFFGFNFPWILPKEIRIEGDFLF